MGSTSRFTRLRSKAAPLLRPMFERIAPIRWMAVRLLGLRQPSEVVLDENRFEVAPGDFGVTLELHATGGYEEGTRRFCLEYLQEGMTFVDIGAHVGLYSVPAAKRVGASGRVLAFEPDDVNRAMLEANLQRNGVSGVEVFPFGVCDRDGRLPFHRSGFNTGDHQLFHSGRGRASSEIEVVQLDTIVDRLDARVDLIKMDVQGAEAKVLAGMQRLLSSDRAMAMIVELSPWMLRDIGDDPLELLEGLVAHGFELGTIDEASGHIESGDAGQILARCVDSSYLNVRCLRGSRS